MARVQRSISLPSRRIAYHVSSSLSCAVRRLGEVRPPISTPVRLFPAVGRWGSPRRCAHPHAPSGDAHQQNHRRKKRTLMGGLSAAAAASRKPSSLQRKKRAFRVACTCFFWNTRKAIIIAKCPALVLLLPQPDATQTTRWTAFSRVPELFHVSAGLRFRVWIKAAHQQERPPTPPQTVAGEI